MARVYREVETGAVSGTNVVAKIVYIIGGFILSILFLRFIFTLFGANRGNPIAEFVYDVSHPFVSPFFGLFNYDPQFGTARFEFETLIAILAYGLLFSLLTRLFTSRDTV